MLQALGGHFQASGSVFYSRFTNMIKESAADQSYAGQTADVRAVTTPTMTFDVEALLGRVAGDEELMVEVIKAAIDARSGETLRAAAHALKGAAGNLGATALSEAASVLERLGAESHLEAAEGAWRQLSTEAATLAGVLGEFDASLTAGAAVGAR